MGIYNRDQIDYGTMIDRAIKNRMGQAYRESDRIIKRGDIRAQEAKDLASTFARGMDYIQYANEQKELENKLKDYENQRANLIRAQSRAEQNKYNPTTFDYQERNRTTTEPNRSFSESNDWMINANPINYYEIESNPTYNPNMSSKEQWLRDHPDKTEEDYYNFVSYMSSIYGG
jgi:polyhydroxyalkanoate synthesis regulator phasin